eukprot:TRINITY_DN72624_c0_g1_i1.p1 TRINITY_DN72624_c0_g1~~TRINITY_DN72624_c0_g1_i1.p1  ORF type:complete len:612 (-),score=114.89 TRINITY_DN72624_c0_g1_i1:151-1986(-)
MAALRPLSSCANSVTGSFAAASTTVGSYASGGSYGTRTVNSREYKEPPPGCFGSGGWQSGGNGKYPQQTFEECEKTRLAFRKLLINRFASVAGAWKALDINRDGKLSFFEFMRACKTLGVSSNARTTWAALDLDRSGFISLAEVDPALVEMLGSLAVTIWAIFGTVENAWKHCFNTRGALRISGDEFVRACLEIGYKGPARAAFEELATDKASTGITRDEFGFLHQWISNGQPDIVGSGDAVSRWAQEVKPWLPPVKVKKVKALAQEFRELLLKSYGDFVRAWRSGLDRDRNGHMDYSEFTRACKDVGFAGNPRDLWTELDVTGNGVVSLWEIDMPTAEKVKEFSDCAKASFGTWDNAWKRVFDTRFDDRVKLDVFREGCAAMGYTGSSEQIFELLDVDRSKFLCWESVAWISGTEVPADPEQERQDVGFVNISGKFKKQTRLQQRRADIIAREQRMRIKKFEGRARGEIPGTNPAAGTTIYSRDGAFTYSPGVSFNSMARCNSSPGTLQSTHSPDSVKAYRRPVDEPELPSWLLIAEGTVKSPEAKPKFDLSFPMFPQSPGKGGWPSRRLKMVDELWGGSKDIGAMLSPLSRKACTDYNLERWRKQAAEG